MLLKFNKALRLCLALSFVVGTGGAFVGFYSGGVGLRDIQDGFFLGARESWQALRMESPYLYAQPPEVVGEVPFGYVIRNRGFAVRWTPKWRQPAWVAYRLGSQPLPHSGGREDHFLTDWRALPWIDHDDYTRSGYDRGHMAPHYAISTQYPLSTRSSFFLSNICPQDPDLNRFLWKDLELFVSKRLVREYAHVYAVCGPVFDDDFTRPDPVGAIPVPDAFFMIVTAVDENERGYTSAWLIPQNSHRESFADNTKYLTDIAVLEHLTGFRFMY